MIACRDSGRVTGCGTDAIEVYVDTSDVWRTDPQAVASISPLTL
jgi:hypothetical protein